MWYEVVVLRGVGAVPGSGKIRATNRCGGVPHDCVRSHRGAGIKSSHNSCSATSECRQTDTQTRTQHTHTGRHTHTDRHARRHRQTHTHAHTRACGSPLTSIAVAASSPFASHTEVDERNFSSSSTDRSPCVRASIMLEERNVETSASIRAKLSSLSAIGRYGWAGEGYWEKRRGVGAQECEVKERSRVKVLKTLEEDKWWNRRHKTSCFPALSFTSSFQHHQIK